MRLIDYKRDHYSQNGEDGVLEFIFKSIQSVLPESKWCVEFGAWDGKHLSNTFSLVEQGWHAVYIEGDEKKYQDLLVTANSYKNIVPLCAMVGFDKSSTNKLDNLLETTPIPDDYELLSIDIDSFDLAVWAAYSGKPKVVVIEINSSLHPGILQWHDGPVCQGNSFSSTLNVAKSKGYTLVCHTGNSIFLRDDLISMVDIPELDLAYPERLFLNDWLPDYQALSSHLVKRKSLLRKWKKSLKKRLP